MEARVVDFTIRSAGYENEAFFAMEKIHDGLLNRKLFRESECASKYSAWQVGPGRRETRLRGIGVRPWRRKSRFCFDERRVSGASKHYASKSVHVFRGSFTESVDGFEFARMLCVP